MSDDADDVMNRVADLRRAFDRSFAAPPREEVGESEDLLTIRIAGEAWFVKVRDVSGLVPCGAVVGLPTKTPELLGVAGLKGGLVAVYSLATLLGYARSDERPRWLCLRGIDEPIGLAFDAHDGYVRVPRAQVFAGASGGRAHVSEVARVGEAVRPIVDISAVVETINGKVGRARADLWGEST